MKFTISYPVRPYTTNQLFGKTDYLAYYKTHGIDFKGHNGIDFGVTHGQPIYAAHDGMAYYEVDSSQGHGVVIISNEQFEYDGGLAHYKTIYWHMCDPVKEPRFKSPIFGRSFDSAIPVMQGDLIGYADSTGLSTGDHLHFGCKPVMKNEAHWTWYNLEQTNGYMGAIDPMPFFDGAYAEDAQPFRKNLSRWSVGADVAMLQVILIMNGFLSTGVFGFFGPKTYAGVILFQKKYGLPETGFVGPLTRKVLNSLKK